MNNSGESADPAREILYVNFNQSSTALSVGTKNGYMIYDLDQVNECTPTYESRNVEDVCIVERNFLTCLIAYVSLHSPRKLIVYNYKKGEEVLNKQFSNTILSVKLNRKHVVVCLEDRIFIHQLMNIKETYTITNIPTNLKGLCALTYGSDDLNSLLAYSCSSIAGDVQIFDATALLTKNTIPAHTSVIAALSFNIDGSKLATASMKGTVIRVFCVASGDLLLEFRRGMSRCVQINSLSFSTDSEFLCASSNTETVHIFKLCAPEEPEPIEEEEGWMEMFGRVLTESAKYLPTQVSSMLTQQRSFAIVHLPFVGQGNICAVTKIQRISYVTIASLEGFLYIYKLDTEVGGSCLLIKQHRLEGPLMPFLNKPKQTSTVTKIKKSVARKNKTEVLPESPGLSCDPTPCLEPTFINTETSTKDEPTECDPYNHDSIPYIGDLPPLLNKLE